MASANSVIRGLTAAVPLLQVFEVQTSLTFYRDVLGFEVVHQTDHDWWAMIRRGDATLMLNTAYEDGQRPERPDARSTRRVTSYGLRQLNIKDPDGYELCFTAPL